MARSIILPGLGGSGPAHWQTLWQARDPEARRFAPESWSRPSLAGWLAALDRALAGGPGPALLVAHSLACLLVAHRAAGHGGAGIAGAFLVAPPDPAAPAFPPEAADFRPVPEAPLPFPALVVASSDDPYDPQGGAARLAAAWGAELVVAGALGHINAASGIGDWPQGAALLERFRQRLPGALRPRRADRAS